VTYRRQDVYKRRVHRRALTKRTAAEAIGVLEPGIEVFGLSKGQYSLIDIIEFCL
jgi:hypothetical protein